MIRRARRRKLDTEELALALVRFHIMSKCRLEKLLARCVAAGGVWAPSIVCSRAEMIQASYRARPAVRRLLAAGVLLRDWRYPWRISVGLGMVRRSPVMVQP